MNTSSPLTIVAICTAIKGKENLLRSAQEILVAETIKESGCIRYELHQSVEDGRILIFVESWESKEQWEAHMEGAAIRRFQAGGAGNYFADFIMHRMKLVSDGRKEITKTY
jgi:quinol monooxygenase YgiN